VSTVDLLRTFAHHFRRSARRRNPRIRFQATGKKNVYLIVIFVEGSSTIE
jgi:hypothetical protein